MMEWLLLIGLILLVAYLIWKIVTSPSVTVSTDKSEYAPGESATFSGTYTGPGGVSGLTVNIVVSPPTGDDYIVPATTTDGSGDYSTAWTIPIDAVDGTYTVSVSCSGATAQVTFTHNIRWSYNSMGT